MRLLVMSATLDIDAVAGLLEHDSHEPGSPRSIPIIRSEGRSYPVETVYLDRPVEGHIEPAVAAAVARAHDRHGGDLLVFLPGIAEIRRTEDYLSRADLPASTRVIPLYGDLPQSEQDRAIAPSPAGLRKIVLATSIAETSLTIEGVRTVIDSGLMRVARFSPRTAMTRLTTVPVSRAAADQRCGRAGRLGPGVCYRLWTTGAHSALLAHRPPEILEADLAALALDLAAWGVADPLELRWIDPPPAAAFAQARELLVELEALDAAGALTPHGAALARLPTHPRIAHMLLHAQALDCSDVACDVAALIGERDILRAHDGQTDPDLRLRLPLLRGHGNAPLGHRMDQAALHRARTEARYWRRRLHVHPPTRPPDDDCAAVLLALAFPDRIARQRGARGHFLLRTGAGAVIDQQHVVAGADMIVAAEIGGHGRNARVFMAVPIARSAVEAHFASQIETVTLADYDVASGAVRPKQVRRLGAIVLGERAAHDLTPAGMTAVLLDAVRQHGPAILPWTDRAVRLRQRLAFLHHVDRDSWPDVSDDALRDTLDSWLLPWIADAARGDALRHVDMAEAMLGVAGWHRRADIDRLAPTHIDVPSGSSIAIDYSDPTAPVLAVRLQEMFGAADTPRIADGRITLTLHLLSPARRPVQVTRDLASFWRTTYFDVRKDLRGRYPKHAWPDDPLVAQPTRRVRPRDP
jgi:ATP-dependent helicase HrpB